MVVGDRRIIIEEMRENQHREGYTRCLEGNGVEWDEENNVEHMWEQVKRNMIASAREERTQRVCGGTMRQKMLLRERSVLGRRCCQLTLKRRKKDVSF